MLHQQMYRLCFPSEVYYYFVNCIMIKNVSQWSTSLCCFCVLLCNICINLYWGVFYCSSQQTRQLTVHLYLFVSGEKLKEAGVRSSSESAELPSSAFPAQASETVAREGWWVRLFNTESEFPRETNPELSKSFRKWRAWHFQTFMFPAGSIVRTYGIPWLFI